MLKKIVAGIVNIFLKKVLNVVFHFDSTDENAFIEEAMLEDLLYPHSRV